MLKKILIGLVVLIVLFVAIGFVLPGTFEVERSVTIEVPPEAVYERITDLTTWPSWTIWSEEQDPSVSFEFENEPGVGMLWRWEGDVLGKGTLAIVSGDPSTGMEYEMKLEDMEPFHGEIAFAAQGSATEVTWHSVGEIGSNPLYRWMGLIMSGMVGDMFQENLNRLKSDLEGAAVPVEASSKK